MKALIGIVVLLLVWSNANAVEYRSDWNYQNFYEAVNICRSAIVFPAAVEYEKKGLASKLGKEQLRNEMIAITPLSESMASSACYCALNEYAKDKTRAEYTQDWRTLAPYMEIPRCKNQLAEAMSGMKGQVKSLTLK